MATNLLDGKIVSRTLRDQLTDEISRFKEKRIKETKPEPRLAVVLVGNDDASLVYIRQKEKACLEVGIQFTLYHLSFDVSTKDVLEQINTINDDPKIHGLIVQLPLPPHVDEDKVITKVAAHKDVDGFHPFNIGRLALNKPTFVPATPYGIELMIKHYGIKTRGQHCVIVGKSLIVGQPLMNLMALEDGLAATVTCCDRYTPNLEEFVKMADILVVATGKHHLIKDPSWIKPGAVVFDVGIHRIPDESKKKGYRLEGDVDYESIKNKCSFITPVPGGVGPMTVVGLLRNTWTAYRQQEKV